MPSNIQEAPIEAPLWSGVPLATWAEGWTVASLCRDKLVNHSHEAEAKCQWKYWLWEVKLEFQ